MFDYLVRRLLLLIPTLLGITIVVFSIVTLAPGDPAALRTSDILDPEMSQRIQEDLTKRFDLDKPVPVRYLLWMGRLVRLDLGVSMSDDNPVIDKITAAFWPTFSVNALSVFLAFVISVPIGIYAAARRNLWFDRVSGVLLYGLYSIPSYVGALVLVYWLGVKWDLLPFSGMYSDDYHTFGPLGKFFDQVAHMTIYVICVMYGALAFYSRFVRQNLLEVIQQDYMRTARAKGLKESVVVVKHGFRNTLIPFLTMIGLIVPSLIGGSVILEYMFSWPGLGRLFFNAIQQRDYPTVMALSTATAVLVLLSTLIVDLMYGLVDPRVSHR